MSPDTNPAVTDVTAGAAISSNPSAAATSTAGGAANPAARAATGPAANPVAGAVAKATAGTNASPVTSPTAAAEGPLNAAELAALEVPLLPSRERHQLRLLAHGLRTLQQIAGRGGRPPPPPAGGRPPPPLAAIQAWARQQPSINDDETFVGAFSTQLQVAGQQLSQLAGDRPDGALALELSELINAAQQQSQVPQA